METVLDLYQEPYELSRPVVCFDEKPCQLLAHARDPLPMRPATNEAPARPAWEDYEYVRQGTTNVLLAVEPLTGKRRIWVRPRHRKIEFAEAIRELLEDIYPETERIRLVCDNLSCSQRHGLPRVLRSGGGSAADPENLVAARC
jgi:hypothetical protein